MGPVAEPPLIELLTNPDADLQESLRGSQVCRRKRDVEGHEVDAPDSEFFVRVAAQDAFKMITLRIGCGRSDGPQTKKAGTRRRRAGRKKS